MYLPPERNMENIEYADIRADLDGKYNDVHDELSAAYYDKKPFRTYGILDKDTFDKLHGLIFAKRDVELGGTLQTLSGRGKVVIEGQPQPPDLFAPYDSIVDKDGNVVGSRTEQAQASIDSLDKEGIALEI